VCCQKTKNCALKFLSLELVTCDMTEIRLTRTLLGQKLCTFTFVKRLWHLFPKVSLLNSDRSSHEPTKKNQTIFLVHHKKMHIVSKSGASFAVTLAASLLLFCLIVLQQTHASIQVCIFFLLVQVESLFKKLTRRTIG